MFTSTRGLGSGSCGQERGSKTLDFLVNLISEWPLIYLCVFFCFYVIMFLCLSVCFRVCLSVGICMCLSHSYDRLECRTMNCFANQVPDNQILHLRSLQFVLCIMVTPWRLLSPGALLLHRGIFNKSVASAGLQRQRRPSGKHLPVN